MSEWLCRRCWSRRSAGTSPIRSVRCSSPFLSSWVFCRSSRRPHSSCCYAHLRNFSFHLPPSFTRCESPWPAAGFCLLNHLITAVVKSFIIVIVVFSVHVVNSVCLVVYVFSWVRLCQSVVVCVWCLPVMLWVMAVMSDWLPVSRCCQSTVSSVTVTSISGVTHRVFSVARYTSNYNLTPVNRKSSHR